jgi:hypothetical protein
LLQPIHYEQFIGNYLALVAVVLAFSILSRHGKSPSRLRRRVPALVAIAAFSWGLVETKVSTDDFITYDLIREDAIAVAKRLKVLEPLSAHDKPSTVFSTDMRHEDNLPTTAPQAVLWARHMHVFSGTSLAENKERFYQQIYYSGVDERRFVNALRAGEFNFRMAIFGWQRTNPVLSLNPNPITIEEVRAEGRLYAEYIGSFDLGRASRPTLSWAIIPNSDSPDLSNLDRWYQRDAGEEVGKFTLYRLTLRSQPVTRVP